MRLETIALFSKRWWVILLAVAVAGVTDLGRSGHMTDAFVFAYFAFIIVVPFGMVGALLVGVLSSLKVIPERYRVTVCVLAGYLVLAAYVGLFVYLAVPAHDILGWDHSRGMNESIWQMHGEEALYADPKVSHDPARYAAVVHRIWQDRLTFLALWSMCAGAVGLVVAAITHWLRSRITASRTQPG